MKSIIKFFSLLLIFILINAQQNGCILLVPGTLRCQVCSSNFQLDDLGNCKLYTPIEGCNVYNSSVNGAQCTTCERQYLLFGGKCFKMINNCQSTSDINTCEKCIAGYEVIEYSHCFSLNVKDCPLGSLPRTAYGKSFCQEFDIINCVQGSADGVCQECSNGYSLINGICFAIQSSFRCPDNSCLCKAYYYNNICYSAKLSNCITTENGIYCNLCGDNYYAETGVCYKYIKANDINCNVLSQDGTRCQGCNLGYILNSNYICVKNFQVCPFGCTSCPEDFEFYRENCYYHDAFCKVYDFDRLKMCTLCVQGYNYDPRTLKCLRVITCETRDATNFCRKCFSGYQLNTRTGQCQFLPNNCLVMSNEGFCTTCVNGAFLNDNNNCIYRTPNCTTYNRIGYCQICNEGFVQVQRRCVEISKNCLTFNVDRTRCDICQPTFRLFNQQCSSIIEGCLTYFSANRCLFCQNSYLLLDGLCYYSDPNCLSYDAEGICTICKNGYLPHRSRCVFYDPYCLEYDLNSLQCSRTMNGFSLASFSMAQRIFYQNLILQANSASSNGLSSTSSASTSSASRGLSSGGSSSGGSASGSSASGGSASDNIGRFSSNGHILSLSYSGISSISIRSYSINGNIMTCNNGFTLLNLQCVIQTINCQRYNQYGRCQECNPGFDLLSDNSCALRSRSSCLLETGGVCMQAAQGFVVISGAAYFAGNNINQISANQLIISANNGYFIYSAFNIAWPNDFNCAMQIQPRKCLRCSSHHFTLENGVCVVKRSRCIVYSPFGLCLGCQQGFMLFAGSCRVSYCTLIDSSTNFCANCQVNYNVQTGICYTKTVNNCQIYNRTSCTNCQSGFYLTPGNICARMIQFCQSASSQTGRCNQCILNYTFFQDRCIPMIENCFRYSPTPNSCANCTNLYYPILNNSVCSYLGFYCSVLDDSNQCITCNTGLTLRQQNGLNICIRTIANCFLYDASIKCMRCNSGYVLQFNRCKSIRCFNFNISRNICEQCNTPFRLRGGFCQDPNCDQSVEEKCVRCLPRFYLNGSECILIPDIFCQLYRNNGTCQTCLPNYTPNTNGICILNDTLHYGCLKREFPCTQCSVGYLLNNSLCYARKCSAHRQNRDCLSCIYYYNFEPTQRFCILYTCSSPSCYLNDNTPDGFELDLDFNLKIRYCIAYNEANCIQCQSYRFPSPEIKYNLCYPFNCKVSNAYNCNDNCINFFSNSPLAVGSCLADNCLSYDSTGKCLRCVNKYELINRSYCVLIQLPFCLVVNYQTLFCETCVDGFEIFNNACRNSFCQTYQIANSSLCSICMRGYIYSRTKNICQLAKCSRFNGNQCLSCILGYTLRNNICELSNCNETIWQTLMCRTCIAGYEIAAGVGICKASNCQTFDNLLNCRVCLNNTDVVYQLRNGVCVGVDGNCLTFDGSGNCLRCRDTSLYVNVADICVNVIGGCIQYNRNGCIRCSSAYNFQNGQCSVKFCTNFTAPSRCSICNPRFDLRADLTCSPRNCAIFNSQSWICDRCEPRFRLSNGFCFTFNCSITPLGGTACLECLAGFTLIQDTCVFSNCPNNLLFECPSCITGFTLIDGVCRANRTGCQQYNESTFSCRTCAQGFNLTLTGFCTIILIPDPYCIAYNVQTTICTTCLNHFVYNGQARQCQSRYCSRFDNNQLVNGRNCIACINGFSLDESRRFCIASYCRTYSLGTGICLSCVGGTSLRTNVCFANNCASFSTQYDNSPICLSCNNGYTLTALNFCIPNNCESYDASTLICTRCSFNFILNNNRICVNSECRRGFIFQNFRCVPANCNNIVNDKCMECLPGFIAELQGCVIEGCFTFNDRYECKECRRGYNLITVNGQFICSLNQTNSCPAGFYLNERLCIAIPIANCTISDINGRECLRCISGFLLKDGICYSLSGCNVFSSIDGCRDCIPGFIKQGIICYSLNCLEIFANNTCRSCIQGYTLLSGICRASIYKCLRTNLQGNCIQCEDNFEIRQGRCVAKGCASYSPISYLCLTCLSDFILNGEICVLKIRLPNCFQALNSTSCRLCNNNFIQLNGVCYIQIQFCLMYNPNNGQCSSCNLGYFINNNFVCSLLPANCQSADPFGNCINCAVGYFIFNRQCRPNIANCMAFDPITSLCSECRQGWYLTNDNSCLNLPSFCVNADRTGACTSCVNGYTVSRGFCVQIIVFCESYNQNNQRYCYQCASTHYLNLNYTCSLLPPNCISANNQGFCLTCRSDFILFNTFCVRRVSSCNSYLQLSDNTTRCSGCLQGFTLNNLFQCTNLPSNCLSIDASGRCNRCISSYQLFGGICVLPIQFCATYNISTFFCSGCLSGYYLFNQLANTFLCQQLPRFCLSANLRGQCLTCLPGYIAYNNFCVLEAGVINCRSYDIRTFVCLECNPRYYLNNAQICTLLPDNCDRVNNVNGFCLECMRGFRLQGQICVFNVTNCLNFNQPQGLCRECAPGYELSSDFLTCHFKMVNCRRFANNNICLECMDNYFLIGGFCYFLSEGCIQLNNNQVCISCRSSFVLQQRECIPAIPNCATYNNRRCFQCIQFFYLASNVCIRFPENCQSYDTAMNRCLSCASGFNLDPFSFFCVRTIINCLAYNTEGRCIGCLNRFYLNQNRCVPFPNLCVNVDLRGNCLSCSFGCSLLNNICNPNNGRQLNCLIFNASTNICSQCIQGYNLCGALGICLLPDPGCQSFSNEGRCLSCKSNYQFHQGRCIQYPTGLIVAPNGGFSCATGYTLQQNSCIRSQSTLTRLSQSTSIFNFIYSSNSNQSPPFIGRNVFWTPTNAQQNQYLGILSSNNRPQIIFQLGIKGNTQGWVSSYIIQFKNRADAPFVCWNSCNEVTGNSDGQNTSLLQLIYPIIATELRIYPVRWNSQINLQLQTWTMSYN